MLASAGIALRRVADHRKFTHARTTPPPPPPPHLIPTQSAAGRSYGTVDLQQHSKPTHTCWALPCDDYDDDDAANLLRMAINPRLAATREVDGAGAGGW